MQVPPIILFGVKTRLVIITPLNDMLRNPRYQPWRAKRRLVDPGSREAALLTRRALRQRGSKVGIRTRRPVISGAGYGAATSLRSCSVVPVTGTAGAIIGGRRSSAFWGLGCRSSRQGCESRRVEVPLPPIVRFRRLAYPLLREVTN